MLPRIFAGAEVVLVAGGPSLAGFDWGRLAGRNVVAINRAYEVLPNARALWWSDHGFYRQHAAQIEAHGAELKCSGFRPGHDRLRYPEWVRTYTFSGVDGFDPDPGCIRHGRNGGYAALHLVAHLGPPRRAVLLGYDMRHAGGRSHWHSGHGRFVPEQTLVDAMLPLFATLTGPLAALGVEVINASPESRIECWPRVTIDDVLDG